MTGNTLFQFLQVFIGLETGVFEEKHMKSRFLEPNMILR